MTRAIAETCYGDLRGSIKIEKWVQSFEKAWVERPKKKIERNGECLGHNINMPAQKKIERKREVTVVNTIWILNIYNNLKMKKKIEKRMNV